MPTYEMKCSSENCSNEWEIVLNITADPPKVCPKCNQETAKRLISLGGKGVVQLEGNDLVDKVKQDANRLKRDAGNSEKIYSNLLGDSKMESVQRRIDKQKRR